MSVNIWIDNLTNFLTLLFTKKLFSIISMHLLRQIYAIWKIFHFYAIWELGLLRRYLETVTAVAVTFFRIMERRHIPPTCFWVGCLKILDQEWSIGIPA